MKLSKHAHSRCQQRGIKPRELEIILSFGDELPAGSGNSIFCVNSKETHREIEKLWSMSRDFDLEGVFGSYLIVAEGNRVVTTGHRKIRFKKDRTVH
jgi:hypothetical protein